MEQEKFKCLIKYHDGAAMTGCQEQVFINYENLFKDLVTHHIVIKLFKTFKYCPYCGKPIQLPLWMISEDEWKKKIW